MNQTQRIIQLIGITLVILALFSTSAAQTQPTVITIWHIATEGDPFRPVLQQALDNFNAAHTNVRFEAQAIANDRFKQQLQQAVASGQTPDVFQTWGGGLLENYVQMGVVRDIPELSGEAKQRFHPDALRYSTFNGKHYAVPANMAGIFLWYNRDLFERFDIELPYTWTQLINACREFKQNGVVPIGLGNLNQWPGSFWYAYLVMRIGGSAAFLDSFQSLEPSFLMQPPFIEAGWRVQEAVNAGCFEPGYNQQDFGTAQTLLATGAAAMQLQGDWNLGGLKNTNRELAENSIGVLSFPSVDGGQGDTASLLGGTGQAFAIAADAPPETADALLELLSSDTFGRSVAENGFIPALVGFDTLITDPLVRQMASMLREASYVQLYYDQLFPPPLAQNHLRTTQQLFDLALTPEQAAQRTATANQQENAVMGQLLGQTSTPLRELAENRGIFIGAAVNVQALRNDAVYAETLRREFNMLTPEMVMKMDALRPAPDVFAFDDADYLVQFAEANGMAVRGHTLVWHRQLPGWVSAGGYTRDELLAVLRDHITTVVSRYRGRVVAWDVVNEAVEEDGSLRNNIWLQIIGPEYIDYAFRWAHEADPDALLFYNDYEAEALGVKSDAVYRLVQGLIERGVPIHGVGLQMHVALNRLPTMADIAANIERLAALGLQVQVTEMDVQIYYSSGTDEERFTHQAQVYGEVARICLAQPACTALVLWGFTDRHTWIPQYTGNPDSPLIFDRDYQPKTAYYALQAALSP